MTISTSAFGKANASGPLRYASLTHAKRLHYIAPAPATTSSNGPPKPIDVVTQRDLFMNVLTANATKRDAKQYLARFKPKKDEQLSLKLSIPQEERNARHRKDQDRLERTGVNLGGLYVPSRAIAESPQFSRHEIQEKAALDTILHVALVYLKDAAKLDNGTLDGVALTLSQLVQLDMRIMIVLDCENLSGSAKRKHDLLLAHGERIGEAFSKHAREGTRLITGALEVSDQGQRDETISNPSQQIAITPRDLLLEPMKRAVTPIVPNLAYTSSGQLVCTDASDVMFSLSQMLSGLPVNAHDDVKGRPSVQTSLDRIVLLNNAGGVPSKARAGGAHVFINLEQEFGEIETELAEYTDEVNQSGGASQDYEQHRTNLRILQRCLAVLPSASSALIVTPQEAASSSQTLTSDDTSIGAGTRRQKNTLIHNLLTNKPSVSSSLPVARLPTASLETSESPSTDMPTSTLVKRGMPLTIIPKPALGQGWRAPSSGKTTLSLKDDPQVDVSRLVHLIEDSFRRKLDVHHYLSRVENRVAGLIVTGEYEGGAILTWEQPLGTSDSARLVPYLDKFAVLASSQGSSGVADILFQAMVRICFPDGVCWRSRKDNPVNKWYFERADGHWQIPDTNWTMFWTGEGVVENQQKWNDYVSVCTNVGPSWADKSKKPD